MARREPSEGWQVVVVDGRNTYEQEYPGGSGSTWRLWKVDAPAPGDPLPPGWRLWRLDDPAGAEFLGNADTGIVQKADEYMWHLCRDEP